MSFHQSHDLLCHPPRGTSPQAVWACSTRKRVSHAEIISHPLSISAKSDVVVLGFSPLSVCSSLGASAHFWTDFANRFRPHLCYLASVSPKFRQAIIQRIQSARRCLDESKYGQSSNASSICSLRCGQKAPLPWGFCHSPTAPSREVPLT